MGPADRSHTSKGNEVISGPSAVARGRRKGLRQWPPAWARGPFPVHSSRLSLPSLQGALPTQTDTCRYHVFPCQCLNTICACQPHLHEARTNNALKACNFNQTNCGIKKIPGLTITTNRQRLSTCPKRRWHPDMFWSKTSIIKSCMAVRRQASVRKEAAKVDILGAPTLAALLASHAS